MIDLTDRDVPADVRGRITETVMHGIAAERRRKAPLAVAAGVAVLAVAGVAIAALVHGDSAAPDAPAAPPKPTPFVQDGKVDSVHTTDDLDRCWQALGSRGEQRGFPARAHWKPVVREASGGANTTGVSADGKSFFCMTTMTSVTVTDPNATVSPVRGTTIRVALADDMGVVAGVAHQHKQFLLDAEGTMMPANHQLDGLFIMHTEPKQDLASLAKISPDAVHAKTFLPVPKPPAPAVVLVDRPLPPPDRTSPDGKRLGECLDKSGWPKSYAVQWQPGARLAKDGGSMQFAVAGTGYGVCSEMPGPHGVVDYFFFATRTPLPSGGVPTELPDATVINGAHNQYPMTGGSVDARARSMSAVMGDGAHREATVLNGTWVLLLPDGSVNLHSDLKHTPAGTIKSVTVRDAHGEVLYEGPAARR